MTSSLSFDLSVLPTASVVGVEPGAGRRGRDPDTLLGSQGSALISWRPEQDPVEDSPVKLGGHAH
jgi:hypothetical protein